MHLTSSSPLLRAQAVAAAAACKSNPGPPSPPDPNGGSSSFSVILRPSDSLGNSTQMADISLQRYTPTGKRLQCTPV